MDNVNEKIQLVVPVIERDFFKMRNNLDIYYKMLPISGITVIGNEAIKKLAAGDQRLNYIEESALSDFGFVKQLILERSGKEGFAERTGWYVQQFVKMAYSMISKDKYYLLWDSDTLPLKKYEYMNNYGQPYFDLKTEKHEAYFSTFAALFPEYPIRNPRSYIAEHMVINVEYMRQLIHDIECNDNMKGNGFQEKIINSIEIKDLSRSGFSEFETYGTYVLNKYPNAYLDRDWKSMRYGGFFFNGCDSLNEGQINWLAKYYDAISFEKNDLVTKFSSIVQSAEYEKKYKPQSLEKIAYILRASRKIRMLIQRRVL